MSRVTTEDIFDFMDAIRARKGPISAEDLRALTDRRGGPIIPELPGHTVLEMRRLPNGSSTADCEHLTPVGQLIRMDPVTHRINKEPNIQVVGTYPQPDGSNVQVVKLSRAYCDRYAYRVLYYAYRVLYDGETLLEVPRDSCTSEPRNVVRSSEGVWYALRDKYVARLSEHHPSYVNGEEAKDLLTINGRLYLIQDGPYNRSRLQDHINECLGTEITGIILNTIPYKRWFTPEVGQEGFEEEPTDFGETYTYVGKVGGGSFETWIAQNFSPDIPELVIGPNWDHVSQTFRDPEHGLCYWATAEMYLYKVAFNPHG
ncbi:MAG: hypothetical protein UY76_C0008G0018 [Candidatus Uhrbacteria bacterium GW2011_GWA2_52_8d]|uniref:Uncharacterized protein n=1 Tax=Candidatus Uhrbacteria bacterium GW2011_GWA2_52_8d TaxID=1618979 RepID=A0A0G1XQL4_9BACT|nr:MAG: hypothetical protein UY76_C0008G0018 [Candidatus Uhrbacteria bacterium GW2011_GWA2_52_8d]